MSAHQAGIVRLLQPLGQGRLRPGGEGEVDLPQVQAIRAQPLQGGPQRIQHRFAPQPEAAANQQVRPLQAAHGHWAHLSLWPV